MTGPMTENNSAYFTEFHKLLLQSRDRKGVNTNEVIVKEFANWVVHDKYVDCRGSSWRVADCGCGMYGFAPTLAEYMLDKDKLKKGSLETLQLIESVTVVGADLDKSISGCMENFPVEELKPKCSFVC